MNPRIKELLAQAAEDTNKKVYFEDYPEWNDTFYQRLVELVVRDCLTFVEPYPNSGDIDDLALESATNQIKAHFGVE